MARPSSSAPAFRRPDPPGPLPRRRASAIPPHITADQTRALVVGRLPRCVHDRDWPTLSNELVALFNALAAPRAVTDIEPLRARVRDGDASTELVAAAFVQLQTAEVAERVAAWGKKDNAAKIETYPASLAEPVPQNASSAPAHKHLTRDRACHLEFTPLAEWYSKEAEYLARLDASSSPTRPDLQPAAASSSRAPTATVAKPTASTSASSAPPPAPTSAPAPAPSSAPAPAPAPAPPTASHPAPSQPASAAAAAAAAAVGPTSTTTAPPPPATFPAARLRVRGITPNPRHTSLRRFLGRPDLPIAVAPDPTNRERYLADYATAAAAQATVRYFEENMVVHKNAKDAVGRIVPPRDALAAAKRVQVEWVFGEPIVPLGLASVFGILTSAHEVGDVQPLPVKGRRKRKRRHVTQRDEEETQVGESDVAAAAASARPETEASSSAAAASSSATATSSTATAAFSSVPAVLSSAPVPLSSTLAGKRAGKRKRSGSEADDERDQERRPAKRAATEQSWGSRIWSSCIIC
ncbi:hypothetical protein GGF31_008970 [Allomyces arbusculus]|nr:hypothetical protein GGF31_008970 [Allomyces arbusculus]